MTAGNIRTLADAVNVGTTLRQCWFRGHSRFFDSLFPAIQREPYRSAREGIEFWAGQRFRLRAPSFSAELPAWDDYISWLLLMQHHGVPTRLLDWTENILVALYFAVAEDAAEDGEILGIDYGELNWRSADWRAAFPDSPPVKLLAASAFLKPDEVDRHFAGQRKPNGPLALVPPFRFSRMAAQMSRFTIHVSTESEAQISFLLRGPSLVRYVVPSSCKRDLARQLGQLGISHETLFRSLDSLGRTICEEILEPDFDLQSPPELP